MEGLFDSIDDFIQPEDSEREIEILEEESTSGVRSFYRPEFDELHKESLWYRLKQSGITIYGRY